MIESRSVKETKREFVNPLKAYLLENHLYNKYHYLITQISNKLFYLKNIRHVVYLNNLKIHLLLSLF